MPNCAWDHHLSTHPEQQAVQLTDMLRIHFVQVGKKNFSLIIIIQPILSLNTSTVFHSSPTPNTHQALAIYIWCERSHNSCPEHQTFVTNTCTVMKRLLKAEVYELHVPVWASTKVWSVCRYSVVCESTCIMCMSYHRRPYVYLCTVLNRQLSKRGTKYDLCWGQTATIRVTHAIL